ncbi:rhomboid-domain-containing protein [Meredithblackwellia eburnea MCA 4105]
MSLYRPSFARAFAYHASIKLQPPHSIIPSLHRSRVRLFTASTRSEVRPTYYQRRGSRGGRGGNSGPWGSYKARFDQIPSNWVLYGVMGANILVFCGWQYGHQVYARFRDASWLIALQNNFTTSWRNISSGRIWTIVTSCFSHEGTGHILVNMISLYFMASPVMAILGNTAFMSLYLFCGISSSVVSLLFNHFTGGNPSYSSHGASGAVYGVMTMFAAAYPRTTFLIFFVVPAPAWAVVSGLFLWDAYSSFNRRGGRTDSAGHVGGIAAGLLWFLRRVGRI